jgi:hypothetical protein
MKLAAVLSPNRSTVSGVRNKVYIKEPHYLLLFEVRGIPRDDFLKYSVD